MLCCIVVSFGFSLHCFLLVWGGLLGVWLFVCYTVFTCLLIDFVS